MEGDTEPSTKLEESQVFHILGNDRRRAIIQVLTTHGDTVDVSDVATSIAEEEAESSTVPNNLYKSVYVSLQQTHLPQLEEDSVVNYDPDAKRVGPGKNFNTVTEYMNGNGVSADTLFFIHLALSVVGLLTIAILGTMFPTAAETVVLGAIVLILVIIAATSLYRTLA